MSVGCNRKARTCLPPLSRIPILAIHSASLLYQTKLSATRLIQQLGMSKATGRGLSN